MCRAESSPFIGPKKPVLGPDRVSDMEPPAATYQPCGRWLAALLGLVVSIGAAAAASGQSTNAEDASAAAAEAVADLGRQAFLRYCRECHGEDGDGLGKFSYTTGERPRSFQSGRFKLATTENAVPSDRDLEETIRRGMPGTGMSAWGQVPEAEIAAMARYTRSFSLGAIRAELDRQVAAGELSAAEADAEFARRTTPGSAIAIPPEPPLDDERRARGERIYLEACASCHGPNGRRLRNDPMPDFEGNHTLPTNIVGGVFKGGNDSAAIYSRLYLGMDGTAMPGYRDAYGPDELWDVVHTVQRIITEGGLGQPEDEAAMAAAATAAREATAAYDSLFDEPRDEVVTYEERGASPILVWGGGALLLLVIVGSALLTSRR